jgi:hypothetical protein
MLNDVIKHYPLIFCSYILFTIDDVTSCMYCGVHVGAPGLFLKPGVTLFTSPLVNFQLVSELYSPKKILIA